MGKYFFDQIIDRHNTNSLKWDFNEARGVPKDAFPLWVADMDFATVPEVTEALIKKAQHGIFGYSEPTESYFEALTKWIKEHHHWDADADKFVLSVSVVFAICNVIDAMTSEGDGIMISEPVYYPFSEAIIENKRRKVVSELVYKDYHYSIDFEDFERKIVQNNVKLYILCNPHNPVGRVWTYDELKKISDICLKHGVFVISDEIHADFINEGYEFTSFAALGTEALNNSVICTAPTKTFNLAGLQNSNIYIPNDSVRRKYRFCQNQKGYSQSNIMGIVAAEAAYRYGEEWLLELKQYLRGNLNYIRDFLREKLPDIRLVEPEGTYLIWLDCSGLGISDKELNDIILNKAKLWLDAGNIFGSCGQCFERINIATPRVNLINAMNALYAALK